MIELGFWATFYGIVTLVSGCLLLLTRAPQLMKGWGLLFTSWLITVSAQDLLPDLQYVLCMTSVDALLVLLFSNLARNNKAMWAIILALLHAIMLVNHFLSLILGHLNQELYWEIYNSLYMLSHMVLLTAGLRYVRSRYLDSLDRGAPRGNVGRGWNFSGYYPANSGA